VIHVRINSQRVHPVSEGLLFSGFFNDLNDFFHRFQTRASVEQVGNKGKVQFGVSGNDISRSDKLSAAQFVGVD